MSVQMFIDGDFPTGKNCEYHCSPTCHPGQIDENEWHYGCTHPAWPANQARDFVPFVECGGDRRKCDLKKYIRCLRGTFEIYEQNPVTGGRR